MDVAVEEMAVIIAHSGKKSPEASKIPLPLPSPAAPKLCCLCGSSTKPNYHRNVDARLDQSVARAIECFIGVTITGLGSVICRNCERKIMRLDNNAKEIRETCRPQCLRMGGRKTACIRLDKNVYEHWRRIAATENLGTDTDIAIFLIKQFENPAPGVHCTMCNTPVKLTRVVCSACKQRDISQPLETQALQGNDQVCVDSERLNLTVSEVFEPPSQLLDKQYLKQTEEVDGPASTAPDGKSPIIRNALRQKLLDKLPANYLHADQDGDGVVQAKEEQHVEHPYNLSEGKSMQVMDHLKSASKSTKVSDLLRLKRRTQANSQGTCADTGTKELLAIQHHENEGTQANSQGTCADTGTKELLAIQHHENEEPKNTATNLKLIFIPGGQDTGGKRLLLPKVQKLFLHPCAFCNVFFTDALALEEHVKRNHEADEQAKFTCKICPDTFDSCEILKKHEQTVHIKPAGSEGFPCAHCDKVFSRKQGMKEHMRVHSGERPFKCDLCNSSFRWAGNLQKHRILHTGKKCMCELCGHTFGTARELRVHIMKKHTGERPFVCDRCGQNFTILSSLRAHLEIKHGDTSLIRGKAFMCDTCGASFSSKRILHRHQHSSSDITSCTQWRQLIGEDNVETLSSGKKSADRRNSVKSLKNSFACKDCGRKCASLQGLKVHYNRTHSDSRSHVCSTCDMSFYYVSDLKEHLLCHTGEKPHRCDKCGACFRVKASLLRHHKYTHLKPSSAIKCKLCGKFFSCAATLRSHMFGHTGERPHICSKCGARFRHKSTLTVHLQVGHNPELKPFICGVCGASYRTRYGLNLHSKKQGHDAYNHINLIRKRPVVQTATVSVPSLELEVETH